MLLGNPLFRRNIAEHGGLLGIISTPRVILHEGVNSGLEEIVLDVRPLVGSKTEFFSSLLDGLQ